jgi:hypothetical protein
VVRRSGCVLSLVLVLLGSASAQRVTFRQDNTALPPFGGYVPGSGAVLAAPPRGPITVRQGSADAALPAFGGYVPGNGARIDFNNVRRAAMLRQQARRGGNSPLRAAAVPANVAPVPAAAAAPATQDRKTQVRALRRRRAAEQLLLKGQQAEAAGNLPLAKKYYLAGLKRDAADVNDALQEQLNQLTGQRDLQP